MPFCEVSAMAQKREFVMFALNEGANVRELCRRFGISPTTGYKWIERYQAEGLAGLTERSRRPHSSPQRTAWQVEAKVLEVRDKSNNVWGGRKIKGALEKDSELEIPAASTITAILRRHERLTEAGAAQHPGPWQRFERETPNELWQMDFKGHFAIHSGRCHPLTTLDDHSRFNLVLSACGNEQGRTVRGELEIAFRHYGLPLAMLMDGGPPWSDPGGELYTVFSVWLLRLGIRVLHGRPRHPQTQGKEERFHRTLKAEVISGRSFGDLADCQRAFDQWRPRYNHERPHEALDMATPAERYRPSPRCFPEVLPAIEYGPGDKVRKVDSDGFISFRNRPWRIGKAFRGELVALRSTDQDGLFSVHYCSHRIATLDLRSTDREACGLVDNAKPCPQGPHPKQQQKQPVSS
ncbi:IS481 family transposase [Mesorhizobium sp. B2-4-17]|uniref:IS481 family transposase n=1 Tax=Mesorhizobium sp. B2-4-17 TaxID=2589932 RepID=UPI001FEDA040|nr:IS481 family transposase [Mesorhizobium sp. B2-4-17]